MPPTQSGFKAQRARCLQEQQLDAGAGLVARSLNYYTNTTRLSR